MQPLKRYDRITPAHAGKSVTTNSSQRPCRDHPRPCGEKDALILSGTKDTGSPPPMRGKGHTLALSDLDIGITPAHAGKRQPSPSSQLTPRDHPRPCGEKSILSGSSEAVQGSPSPMRGKEYVDIVQRAEDRITPAHAGKRRFAPLTRSLQ